MLKNTRGGHLAQRLTHCLDILTGLPAFKTQLCPNSSLLLRHSLEGSR